MKELKCERCGDLFVQGYDEQDMCGQCITEIEAEEYFNPDSNRDNEENR